MPAADEKPTRIEIGFEGGQVIAARMSPKQLTALRKAVESTDGWHDLETEDGAVALDLAKVVFVRGEAGEHSVGFSGP
jgi:hypothetical protein